MRFRSEIRSQSGFEASPGDEAPRKARKSSQTLRLRPQNAPRLRGRPERIRDLFGRGKGHPAGRLPLLQSAHHFALQREGSDQQGPDAAFGGRNRPEVFQHHRQQGEKGDGHPKRQLGPAAGDGGVLLPPHLPHGGHRREHADAVGDPAHHRDALRRPREEPGGAERGDRDARGPQVRQHHAGLADRLRHHRGHPGDPPAGAGLRRPRGGGEVQGHAGVCRAPHPASPPGRGEADAGVCAVAQLGGRHGAAPRGIRRLGSLQAGLHPPLRGRQREDVPVADEPDPDAGGLPAHHHPQGAAGRVLPRAGGGQRGRRQAFHPLHRPVHRDHAGHADHRHHRVLRGAARSGRQHGGMQTNHPRQDLRAAGVQEPGKSGGEQKVPCSRWEGT